MSNSRCVSGKRFANDVQDPPCSAGGAAAVGALSKPRGLGGLGAALSLSKVPRTPVQARYEARPILERASARETAARVAVGTVCKAFLGALGITVLSHVIEIGDVRASDDVLPGPEDLDRIDASPLRTLDQAAEARMIELIEEMRRKGDTLGGVFEVLAFGVPVGIGSHVQWDRRLDGQLAQALM